MIEGRFTLVDKGEGACNAAYIDNVVDLAILSGSHPRAAGEAFLVRDKDRLYWKGFFGYYADMIGMNINDFPSVKSEASFNRATGRISRLLLIRARHLLRRGMRICAARFPALVRYGRKAPNKLVRLVRSAADPSFPDPYSWWDLMRFSSPGFINTDKAKSLLGFTPRITVPEGMRDCDVWLRGQCYLPTRSDIFTSGTQRS
jgi:nucleoside-diphosphate-sugar epimerase